MTQSMTAQEFAEKLAKHLEEDMWGDIDSDVFRAIAQDDPDLVIDDAGQFQHMKQYLIEIFGE